MLLCNFLCNQWQTPDPEPSTPAFCLQALQHTWTYKPLVHDVLGLHLNSLTIEAPAGQQLMPQESKRRYDVGPSDFT